MKTNAAAQNEHNEMINMKWVLPNIGYWLSINLYQKPQYSHEKWYVAIKLTHFHRFYMFSKPTCLHDSHI